MVLLAVMIIIADAKSAMELDRDGQVLMRRARKVLNGADNFDGELEVNIQGRALAFANEQSNTSATTEAAEPKYKGWTTHNGNCAPGSGYVAITTLADCKTLCETNVGELRTDN